ncbi:MAG: helix-turn-helix transcriptional regulator [Ruminococcus sp.]|uniref:helix-turn-helix domain-containing protein n=1 Tax=Ruminococcus sp. TaxID=41978 RepID=UPI0025EF5675|nr:helix-turn-helix transcriptional regulator [Ruminococcus sp.]MBO4867954.1 helix-turn-helix transcriptional regulator [Ruminococcus sp.]
MSDDNRSKLVWKKIGMQINSLIDKQKALADHLGVKPNVVSYWCKGERTPNTEQIIKIAEYFNVSTDYLLCRTKEKTTDITIQAICAYTGLSEEAIKRLNLLKGTDTFSCDLFSQFLLDWGLSHILYLVQEKINLKANPEERQFIKQNDLIDYSISKTITEIVTRLTEKNKPAPEIVHSETDKRNNYSTLTIQLLSKGIITEEQYQELTDEYNPEKMNEYIKEYVVNNIANNEQ